VPQRVRVTFSAQTREEEREGLSTILEVFGTVYKSHNPAEIVILPDEQGASGLRTQLTAWEEQGKLAWSDAT